VLNAAFFDKSCKITLTELVEAIQSSNVRRVKDIIALETFTISERVTLLDVAQNVINKHQNTYTGKSLAVTGIATASIIAAATLFLTVMHSLAVGTQVNLDGGIALFREYKHTEGHQYQNADQALERLNELSEQGARDVAPFYYFSYGKGLATLIATSIAGVAAITGTVYLWHKLQLHRYNNAIHIKVLLQEVRIKG